MRKRANWIFLFGAIGAVAALLTSLQYFGITAKDWGKGPVLTASLPMALPAWAIGLFIFSIGLSCYGFYLVNRPSRLMGEIREGFFQDHLSGADSENMFDSFITLRVHVVNRSPTATTLKDWKLNIEAGGKVYNTQKEGALERFVIDREIRERVGIGTARKMVPETLDSFEALIKNKPLVQNVGIDGWMRFAASAFDPDDFTNGRYLLTMIDAIGNQHLIVREASMPWPKNGTIREA